MAEINTLTKPRYVENHGTSQVRNQPSLDAIHPAIAWHRDIQSPPATLHIHQLIHSSTHQLATRKLNAIKYNPTQQKTHQDPIDPKVRSTGIGIDEALDASFPPAAAAAGGGSGRRLIGGFGRGRPCRRRCRAAGGGGRRSTRARGRHDFLTFAARALGVFAAASLVSATAPRCGAGAGLGQQLPHDQLTSTRLDSARFSTTAATLGVFFWPMADI